MLKKNFESSFTFVTIKLFFPKIFFELLHIILYRARNIKKIKNNELWSPICFLLHEYIPKNQSLKILKELQNEFKDPETVNEILHLIKQHDLTDMIKSKAENELKMAKECLLNLKIDIHPLLQLTQFSVI